MEPVLPNGNPKLRFSTKNDPGHELKYSDIMDDLEDIRRSGKTKIDLPSGSYRYS